MGKELYFSLGLISALASYCNEIHYFGVCIINYSIYDGNYFKFNNLSVCVLLRDFQKFA